MKDILHGVISIQGMCNVGSHDFVRLSSNYGVSRRCFVLYCFSLEGRRHTGRKPLIRKRFVRLTPLGTGSRLYMNRKRIRLLVHPSVCITTIFFILFYDAYINGVLNFQGVITLRHYTSMISGSNKPSCLTYTGGRLTSHSYRNPNQCGITDNVYVIPSDV